MGELNELIKMLESMIPRKALYSEQIGSEFWYMRCRPDPKSCVIEQAAKELKRLAEIQEVLGDDYNLNQLREALQKQSEYEEFMDRWKDAVAILETIKKAVDDGQCVLLPCKIGDTVYVVTYKGGSRLSGKEIVECKVNTMRFKSDGLTVGYSCRGVYSNGNYYNGNFVFASIGKTVFLTREEADSALEKMNEKLF